MKESNLDSDLQSSNPSHPKSKKFFYLHIFFADVNDPKAADLNSLEDVEKEMPGFLDNTREWFR